MAASGLLVTESQRAHAVLDTGGGHCPCSSLTFLSALSMVDRGSEPSSALALAPPTATFRYCYLQSTHGTRKILIAAAKFIYKRCHRLSWLLRIRLESLHDNRRFQDVVRLQQARGNQFVERLLYWLCGADKLQIEDPVCRRAAHSKKHCPLVPGVMGNLAPPIYGTPKQNTLREFGIPLRYS